MKVFIIHQPSRKIIDDRDRDGGRVVRRTTSEPGGLEFSPCYTLDTFFKRTCISNLLGVSALKREWIRLAQLRELDR